jgi:hypothetical protein
LRKASSTRARDAVDAVPSAQSSQRVGRIGGEAAIRLPEPGSIAGIRLVIWPDDDGTDGERITAATPPLCAVMRREGSGGAVVRPIAVVRRDDRRAATAPSRNIISPASFALRCHAESSFFDKIEFRL